MNTKILLISKDVFMRDYLPIYGNKYNKTPNINELAKNGTVFNMHYTAAPSTAMAFTSMSTGLYAYQTDRKKYTEVSEFQGETLFDTLYSKGYNCHIIWDKSYMHLAHKFSKCYGKNTEIHNTDFLTRAQPRHVKGVYDDMSFYPELSAKCLAETEKLTKRIVESSDHIFMWIHFPHALLGRNAYGSDIDLLDDLVGMFRKYFSDDSIYITADHGHMNGSHGKYGYGFDVFENAIRIPLITPRINNISEVNFPTSNVQLGDIIMGKLEEKEYIFSETAYYMQPHRKIAIIKYPYKYIYEKSTKNEYLYDISWDPNENINLLNKEIFDIDRKKSFSITQRFFYPKWNCGLDVIANDFRSIKSSIWRNGPFWIEFKEHLLLVAKRFYMKYFEHF